MSPAESDRRFPRQRRLRKAAEYARVFARPVKVSSAHFTALARPAGRDHARLGLAIAKRRIRRACARNRIKRLIRESFRMHQHALGNLDIVVMARSGAENRGNAEIFQDLEVLWQKLKQRCEAS